MMRKHKESFHCKMDFTTANHKEEYSRMSYRCIVKRDNKYLVIQSNEGDIIFPGGGIEVGEEPEEAIYRELEEETGYQGSTKPVFIGSSNVKKDDKYKANASYEINCHYYTCQVEDKLVERKLTSSEIALEIVALWMTKEEILTGNKAFAKKLIDKDYWVEQMEWLMERV